MGCAGVQRATRERLPKAFGLPVLDPLGDALVLRFGRYRQGGVPAGPKPSAHEKSRVHE